LPVGAPTATTDTANLHIAQRPPRVQDGATVWPAVLTAGASAGGR